MMMRLFWRECREQAWFAVAAFLSPALVALANSLMPGGPSFGSGPGALALTYVLFAVWGAWVVARERDRGRSEMSIVPVSPTTMWFVRALPGLLTATLTGVFARLLMYQQAASTPTALLDSTAAVGLPSMPMLCATMVLVFAGAFLITLTLRNANAPLKYAIETYENVDIVTLRPMRSREGPSGPVGWWSSPDAANHPQPLLGKEGSRKAPR